jgi:transposase-like protein
MDKKEKSKRYSPEVKERAVRMVLESRPDHPSLWSAVESIAQKIGCVPQTLLEWVRKHDVDSGTRDGVTPKNESGSRLWNARTRSCAARTKS